MKNTGKIFIGAALVLGVISMKSFVSAEKGHEGHGGQHGGKSEAGSKKNVKVMGEVIDITCFVSHEGKGEKHKSCGMECLEKGLPVGLAEAKTGKIYLVVTNRHEPANKELKGYMADQVTITGDIHEGNGVTLLLMSKVEKKK